MPRRGSRRRRSFDSANGERARLAQRTASWMALSSRARGGEGVTAGAAEEAGGGGDAAVLERRRGSAVGSATTTPRKRGAGERGSCGRKRLDAGLLVGGEEDARRRPWCGARRPARQAAAPLMSQAPRPIGAVALDAETVRVAGPPRVGGDGVDVDVEEELGAPRTARRLMQPSPMSMVSVVNEGPSASRGR